MRVFVTGATGFVGSAVVRELIAAGHQVLGLARSDASADALLAVGAMVHRGDLDDYESLRAGASRADGVIHTAFNHDFSRFAESCATDGKVIAALGSALEGSDRPLVVTSGIGLLAGGKRVTEQDMPDFGPNAMPRVATERATADLVARGINVSVMRLPPSVHGAGDHGFVPILIGIARDKGVSACVGDGNNAWPAVHRFDAARAFVRAVEVAMPGAVYHAVAETGIPFHQIAGVIGRGLGVPMVSKTPDEAADHFGWFTHFAKLDCPTSSKITRRQLDWSPQEVDLLGDIDQPYYFTR
ncbi:SDR family oxidoreductase [Thalassospira alkalitolerans]|uniref:3-beta hydroxysteroid dehydrogenase n=1 Tax=Thalassospira alkalitolerans TaxID=1293890 RepID=A0A1Y2LB36_9PROT|nr:SDR family oxidoreductase [Thalassospira alkalitolerans]OSQ46211.1 3-beta hydroxysteroid dehydrogenase [Thalassospira alkalitolerans]|tara:strand:- start:35442 stop:36338 length:897 start_codon:yes stop_codon:yes gene_type:complete